MTQLDHYAVFGNPIAHSKSPTLHAAFAEQTQQGMNYVAKHIEVSEFEEQVKLFFSNGGKGINITVPFKEAAFALADQLSSRAKKAGAVNTLWCDQQGQIHGDTTDGPGLVNDILEQGWELKDKTILILGAGGAVRGVLQSLIECAPKSLCIVNRTVAKAEALADVFANDFAISACGYDELGSEQFDVIINASSASLSGELPPLPETILHQHSHCYDMMYGKDPTPFLQWAENQGIKNYSDGLGMLVGQGAESFTIWRGIRPNWLPVVAMLRDQL